MHFNLYSPVLLPCLFAGGMDGFSRTALEREKDKKDDSGQSEREKEFLLLKVTVTLGLLPSQTHTAAAATRSLTQ